MHLLGSKRRGRGLPSGLPLEIKQEFLQSEKDVIFSRPIDHSRSLGESLTIQELELEIKRLDKEIDSISKDKVTNSTVDLQDLLSLKEYKKNQLMKLSLDLVNVKSEFSKMSDDNSDALMGLIGRLQTENDDLQKYLEKFT
jgi:hypothetical protein